VLRQRTTRSRPEDQCRTNGDSDQHCRSENTAPAPRPTYLPTHAHLVVAPLLWSRRSPPARSPLLQKDS
jgi:hypothetical protein